MNINYNNYFKDHYNYSFSNEEVVVYEKWFTAQWNFMLGKIPPALENKKILEIGSSVGGFYNILNKHYPDATYTGLELDKEAVAFCNKNYKQNSFLNLSLEDFNLDNKLVFDYIFAMEVLEHLSEPLNATKKIFSMLPEGGVFCGTTPYPYKKNVLADSTHLSVLHPLNWLRVFNLSGFKNVQIYPMSFVPYLWRINPKLNILLPFYTNLPYFISTTLIIATK